MDNKRHIHTKIDIAKVFGHIVANVIKPTIGENVTPFQIGGIPGHCAQEHLFTVKSVIAMVEKNEEAVAVQFYDLVKYFDKENLLDILDELHKNNIRGRMYKLIYELNKDTRVTVRTPVGDSNRIEIGEGMGQGSFEGALVSSLGLSSGVKDFFEDSETEMSYGSLNLASDSAG